MLRRIALVFVLGAASAGSFAPQNRPLAAELVLLDARILTVDSQFREARALAVRDGRFVAVGSVEEIRPYIGNATRVIEGRGRSVIPGLIETHVQVVGVVAAGVS